MKRLLLLGVVLALLAGYANLQFPNLAAGRANASGKKAGGIDKIDIDLIVINALVTDIHNQPVPGLTHHDFVITEDGVKQELVVFASGDNPVNFGLVFDISESEPLKHMAQQAARSFVSQLRSTDEIVIPQLNPSRQMVRDFAASEEKLENALSVISSNNKSPMFGAIAEAINSTEEKRQSLRRSVVVITDGLSMSGAANDRDAAYAILRKNTPIYFIILADGRYRSPAANQSRVRQNRNLLTRIAEVSGGQTAVVKSENEIAAATGEIINRLKNQYTMGYYPTNDKADGSFRYVSIAATPKDKRKVKVIAPLGYYAQVLK